MQRRCRAFRPPQSLDGPAAPLDIARLFCLRIQTLGITWFITDEPRYRDRAKCELLKVCAFPDWNGDKFLVTAETAFGAAIGYDWLYDALDALQTKFQFIAVVVQYGGDGAANCSSRVLKKGGRICAL